MWDDPVFMKALRFISAVCLLVTADCAAQGVGIGTSTPHASAQLDVVSSSKGLAIPSMTTAQRNAIPSPKAGLFVFDTNKQTLCMFNGSNWVYFQTSAEPNYVMPIEVQADDGQVGDNFGYSISVSGNYAVVGAPYDNIAANVNQGSAYIFYFNGTSWTQQAKLTASNGAANDNFGFSVSISGDYVIIGAPYDDVGAFTDEGSAYIFTRSGTTWSQQANITGGSAVGGDNFGFSVSIDGSYCTVGAPGDDVGSNADQGTAYYFHRVFSVWSQEDYKTLPGGAAGDQFGFSVGVSGVNSVVGSPYDDSNGRTDNGSSHFFQRSGSAWSHIQLFEGNNTNDLLGYSVSMSDTNVVVSHPHTNVANGTFGADAYFYNGTNWVGHANSMLHLILGQQALSGTEGYGFAVAAGGSNFVVTAPFSDTLGLGSGMAYLYQTDNTDNFFVRYITDPLGGASQEMGRSAAASATWCFIGVPKAYGNKGKILILPVQ